MGWEAHRDILFLFYNKEIQGPKGLNDLRLLRTIGEARAKFLVKWSKFSLVLSPCGGQGRDVRGWRVFLYFFSGNQWVVVPKKKIYRKKWLEDDDMVWYLALITTHLEQNTVSVALSPYYRFSEPIPKWLCAFFLSIHCFVQWQKLRKFVNI